MILRATLASYCVILTQCFALRLQQQQTVNQSRETKKKKKKEEGKRYSMEKKEELSSVNRKRIICFVLRSGGTNKSQKQNER